jgi:hypothetical protein
MYTRAPVSLAPYSEHRASSLLALLPESRYRITLPMDLFVKIIFQKDQNKKNYPIRFGGGEGGEYILQSGPTGPNS